MNRGITRRALVISVLAGCAAISAGRHAGAASTKLVFVLFDLSGSTNVQEVRRRYYEDFTKVLAAVKPGDAIVADAITDNPLAQSTFPINEEFEKYNPALHNPVIHKKKGDQQKARVLQTAKEMLYKQGQRVPSTKILDALHLAERIFNTYKRDEKVLVLFSDMVEESDRYNFRKARLTDKETEQIIANEKAKKRLPDLRGVRVYVTGASAGGHQGMSSEMIFSIRDFWLRYFKACGADLTKARYGSSLPKFEE